MSGSTCPSETAGDSAWRFGDTSVVRDVVAVVFGSVAAARDVVELVFGSVAVVRDGVELVCGSVAAAFGLEVVVVTLCGEVAGDVATAAAATAPPAASAATGGGGGAIGRTVGLAGWNARFGSSFPWLAFAGAFMARMV